MLKYLVVANWKMNPENLKEAKWLFETVKKGVKSVKNAMPSGRQIEVVICPPFVYLSALSSGVGGLTLGAQNVFYKEKGAFTGEVSPLMLKDLKVRYVIVGHSESKKYFNETDEVINKKIKEILLVKLKPIFCVGETIEEKQLNNKFKVLEKQIKEGLKEISVKKAQNIVIAYEPVWAIGTGRRCSVDETINSILFIRKIISKLYGRELSDSIMIIYGGSVDSKNSNLYIKKTGVNGLLVGGDSLNAEEFVKIVKSAK